MESVSAHPFGIVGFRDRIVVSQRAVSAMECRVEASDLRQIGTSFEQRSDRRQIVRLVERSKRNVALETVQHLCINLNGTGIFRSAMDDPMADCGKAETLALTKPGSRNLGSGRDIRNIVLGVSLISQCLAVRSDYAQMRRRAHP